MQAIQITDGRTSLWQWDTGVSIKVYGCTDVDQMHFVTPAGVISKELVKNECDVPDAALQTEGLLKMYAYDRTENGGVTRCDFMLLVKERPKPADYIDPPDEYDNLSELAKRVASLIPGGGGEPVTPEQIQQAVDNYLDENPVQVEETDPTVPGWAKAKQKPYYTAEEVGAQPKGDYALKSEIPSVPVQSVNGKTGKVVLSALDVDAQPKGDYALKSDIPDVPVKSVNGKTGTVVLNASDVGAQPKGDYALKSDVPEILVKSVNGKTGDVVLTAQNVGAIPADAEIVDQTARDGVATLSKEIEALKGGTTETITKTGAVISINADEGAEIEVTSDVAREVTLLHHGRNFLPNIGSGGSSSGITWSLNDDGSIHISGTATAGVYINIVTQADQKYLPVGEYVFATNFPYANDGVNKTGGYVALESKDGGFSSVVISDGGVKNVDVTTTSRYISNIYIRSGQTVNDDVWVQLELGRKMDVPPAYTPYAGEEIGTTLPATVTAYNGENILYTKTGDVITARTGVQATGSKPVSTFDPAAYGLPMLYLTGDTSSMTKDVAVDLAYQYGAQSGTASVKWQGASSLSYPKKNYTIKFDQEFEAKEGWGAQKKYCFKANYIDHSHARNICSCKLWGEITKSRANVPEVLSVLPNGGAIDGFPCIIMLNGEFHGLYTWNIPKDGWMFGNPKAILCADAHTDATKFKALATLNGDFELEYVEDEDNADWVLPSINTAIEAVLNSDGSDVDTTIGRYIDIPSAIDYYVHTVDENADDGIDKNYILVTFDGVKWYFSAYDRDTVYGLHWDGKSFVAPDFRAVNYSGYASRHKLMELIYTNKKADLKSRAITLRNGIKSEINVTQVFSNFMAGIPSQVLNEDARKWPTIPSTSVSNLAQILNWYRLRRQFIDAELDAMT